MSKLYKHGVEHIGDITYSNSRKSDGWKATRGAVRWGADDFVLWKRGKCIGPFGGKGNGVTMAEARRYIETGKLPKRMES